MLGLGFLICQGKLGLSPSWDGWHESAKELAVLERLEVTVMGAACVHRSLAWPTEWELELLHSHRPNRGSREIESLLRTQPHGAPAGMTQGSTLEKRERKPHVQDPIVWDGFRIHFISILKMSVREKEMNMKYLLP